MKLRNLVLTALFAALTAIGAFIRIPFAFSSITLQFFFTAMAGILLGARYGAASQAVYVLLGLVGLPIFTSGGGFGYVLQPTFGFLVGLIPAAWLIGFMSRKNGGFWWLCLSCLAGLGALYLVGMPYMAVILYGQRHESVGHPDGGHAPVFARRYGQNPRHRAALPPAASCAFAVSAAVTRYVYVATFFSDCQQIQPV